MRKSFFLLWTLLFAAGSLAEIAEAAGKDIKGSSDPGSLPRLQGYVITHYSRGPGAYRFLTSDGETAAEGERTSIVYRTDGVPASIPVILNGAASAITRAGGHVLWKENLSLGGRRLTGRVSTRDRVTWFHVEALDLRTYTVTTVVSQGTGEGPLPEIRPLNPEADRTQAEVIRMIETLDATGELTLPTVTFFSGQAYLESQADAALRKIVSVMDKSPSFRFRIEAPADPPGTPEERRALAQERREILFAALVALGADGRRLETELPLDAPPLPRQVRLILVSASPSPNGPRNREGLNP
jgi:outer membrane protein OmpA-like peptidoglycan-associated protein